MRNLPKEILDTCTGLENAGFEAFLVGGCIRDLLLNKKPKDWDITTDAIPEEIQKIFPNSFYDNSFGTVSVKNESDQGSLKIIQITPYREEAEYSDNRRPDSVIFGKNIKDDLGRRDFTINAMAYRPISKDMVDLYKGQEDIKKRVIRTVGSPEERFKEDALRMLRAVRLSCQLDFIVSQETADSILNNSGLLKKISSERIRDEFTKIIESDKPEYGLFLLQKLHLLEYIVPELLDGVGMEQNQAHSYDVWTHIIKSVQAAADKKWPFDIRLAALFHDIGKPKTRRPGIGKDHKWTFYGHDVVGARMAKEILERLKFPKEIIDKTERLVRWHMFFSDTEEITPSAVRRLIVKVGKENIWDLMNLRICDRVGTGRPKESPYRLRKYHAMIDEVLRDPISVNMLRIDGTRIMELGDIKAGPKIGWILNALLQEVLEDPKKNDTKYLEKKTLELVNIPNDDLRKMGESGKEKKEIEEGKEVEKIRDKHYVK